MIITINLLNPEEEEVSQKEPKCTEPQIVRLQYELELQIVPVEQSSPKEKNSIDTEKLPG